MYVDADYGGDKDTRRSTSGMVVMMNGGPISWQSRLQKLCAQSTAESEIYAVVEAVKEAIHLKLLCEEVDMGEGKIRNIASGIRYVRFHLRACEFSIHTQKSTSIE
jgi:hypothetical protein